MDLLHRALSSAQQLLWPGKELQSDTKFKPEAAVPAVSLCSPSARLSSSGRASTEIKENPRGASQSRPHKPQ